MAQGHETFYGQKTGPEFAELEANKQATWAAYQSLPCAPGWQQSSINAAAASARAQYQLDKARGYRA
jgi:hypothetical protein